MAKSSHDHGRPRLLALELWGLGDLALAVPFLSAATQHAEVTLVAKPEAEVLLRRFVPAATVLPLTAPWTAFRGKYRLLTWPWRELRGVVRTARQQAFTFGVSARLDPRDHLFLRLAGARERLGFPRAGSSPLLNRPLARPPKPHRADHWRAIATSLGWTVPDSPPPKRSESRRVVVHAGAAQPTRRWPAEKFEIVIARLQAAGWDVVRVDDSRPDVGRLIAQLETAACFFGNDSGPGHVAALLGVPTFTLFGPALPEVFSPVDPRATWIAGAPCPYKPCYDQCRFAVPQCIVNHDVDAVWQQLQRWIATLT